MKFLAYLCLKDMDYLMELLGGRQREIEELWTQRSSVEKVLKRIRKPKYYDIPIKDLMSFPNMVLRHIDEFFDKVDKFLFYLEFTVDMPTTFSENYSSHLAKLRVSYEVAHRELQKYAK
jgi:hypothetical protein